MAKIIFSNREKIVWLKNENNRGDNIANAINQISNELDEEVSLVDEDGNDLSIDENGKFIYLYI